MELTKVPKTDLDVESFVNNYWLGLGDITKIQTANPFRMTEKELSDPARYFMRAMMDPQFFYFTAKHLFNMTLGPMQIVVLRELWNRPFPIFMGTRGFSKTTLLAVYSMLKAILNQGSKIVVCGAGLRQSRMVFDYCNKIWFGSDLLRDLIMQCGSDNGPKTFLDKLMYRLGDSEIVFIPIGDGSKVRGLRATTLICDEFDAINPEIFEVVLSGFTAVSQSPIESMKYSGRMRAMKALGLPTPDDSFSNNQSIISGTAGYSFNHFCAYWKKWKSIIESRGDIRKLEELFQGDVPEKFDWRDYSIIRIPVELMPEGFMEAKSIAKAKVTLSSTRFNCEYGCVFSSDSNGFFKRTLIESCVARDIEPIIKNNETITFNPRLSGNINLEYIFGIDPASEKDRFSIVIVEIHKTHRRIVYCWSTRRGEFKEKLQNGLQGTTDYYEYCSRKIRELMAVFPCKRIVMDKMGGGIMIAEALQNRSYLQAGELPIYEIVEEGKEKPTDNLTGLKILEFAMFSDAKWVMESNHGLKKDFEDKVTLFPDYDAALLSLAEFEDSSKGRIYDGMEDCIFEIEELKEELATIIHTQTGTQLRDRWDTPEVKLIGNKKGRLRKDRYSALLMANMGARMFANKLPVETSQFYGAVVQQGVKYKPTGNAIVTAPDWFKEQGGFNCPPVAFRR